MEYYMKEDKKGHNSDKEEEQEEEEEDKNNHSKYLSPNCYNYGSSSSTSCSQTAEAINFMELSLRNAKEEDSNNINKTNWPPNSEREHMFDKVVTPSDVGKLNRLVIPKQHAEKYFPLDSSNEKGLLLNFQDRTGKLWRFRYSYWNSSQSYVMTKGWSRFVKDKKLDAGDIVSFERSVRDSNVLYIDWRRRPPPPLPPNQASLWGGGGGGRFYSMPQRLPSMSMPLRHHEHFHYNIHHPYHPHHQYQYHHMNPYQLQHQQQQYYHNSGISISPAVVIDSVPLIQHHHHHSHHHGKTMSPSSTNKRLRLFGVNMECSPMQEEDEPEQCQILSSTVASLSPHQHHHLASSSSSLSHQPLELRLLPNYAAPLPAVAADQLLSEKGKSTSLSFYLDP